MPIFEKRSHPIRPVEGFKLCLIFNVMSALWKKKIIKAKFETFHRTYRMRFSLENWHTVRYIFCKECPKLWKRLAYPAAPRPLTNLKSLFKKQELVWLQFCSRVFVMTHSIFSGCLCGGCFLISLSFAHGGGNYIFTLFDNFSGNIPLLLIALFECIGVCYFYGIRT